MDRIELSKYIGSIKSVNSHSHHLSDAKYAGMTLKGILSQSYCGWMDDPPKNTAELKKYILKNSCNSYFHWMFRSLEELYGLSFSIENFDELSKRIENAHKDPSWQLKILRENCNYEKVMLDYFENPGDDLAHPDIFSPVFRCNMFAVCSLQNETDHNGNNPFNFLKAKTGVEPEDFDSYLDSIFEYMRRFKAIKFAVAYDWDLDFQNFDKEKAKPAFLNQNASVEQKKNYYDYIVFQLSEFAGELNIPVQIHTGLGNLNKSAPIYLLKLIDSLPNVKFDLFHSGFPWTDDTLALVHNYKNVYTDICWLPIISSTVARRFIKEALETGDCHRILWGCDTWTSEESYGTVLAAKHALSGALTDMYDEGFISADYARYIADRIMRENGMELYNL